MTKIPHNRLRHDLGTTGAPKKTADTVSARIQRLAPSSKPSRKSPKR